jgi:6-phosphogluconolactonase
MATLNTNLSLKVFPSAEQLFHFVAQDFSRRAIEAVCTRGRFCVVLSGGETPKSFFDILAQESDLRETTPWKQIFFFFGDERYVPIDDERSNYRAANEHLFSKLPIEPDHIFPISTTFQEPDRAAQEYENTIRSVFHLPDDAFPAFDFVYLGLGEDAHTASLMPGSEALLDSGRLVVAVSLPNGEEYRVTLTPKTINHAKVIAFLVIGEKKASAVREVLEGPRDPRRLPAQLIRSIEGETLWLLDIAAGLKL